MRTLRVHFALTIAVASLHWTTLVQAQTPLEIDPLNYQQWTARASVVYLLRDDPENLQYFQAPGGNDAFNFSQFDFDNEPGLDVSIFRELGGGQRIEARYLGLWNVFDRVTVQVPPGLGAINTNPPLPFGLDPVNTLIHSGYDSELHSGELNYCLDESPGQTWIIGFRYLNIGEEFHADYDFATLPIEVDNILEVDNNLYGLQVGAEADLFSDWMGACRLIGFVKAGVYGAQSNYDYSYTQPPVFDLQGSNDDTDIAFVGEAGLTLNRSIGYNTSLLLGYRLLWIDGVALAAEQIDNTSDSLVNPVPVTVDNSGDLFYHGATLGVEYRY